MQLCGAEPEQRLVSFGEASATSLLPTGSDLALRGVLVATEKVDFATWDDLT